MINVFYTCLSHQCNDDVFEFYLNKLPNKMKRRVLAYKNWRDRHNYLFGKMLLLHGIDVFGLRKFDLDNMKYSPYGKPYFDESINFNISHSGKYVVCALSDEGPIGIDVEEVRDINIDNFRQVWTVNEWKRLNKSFYVNREFFYLWTRKEAVIKADGQGLSIELESIDVSSDRVICNGDIWYLKELLVDNEYFVHLAIRNVKMNKILHERIMFY